jgi:hypothetical protein
VTIHEIRYVPGPDDRAWTTVNGIRFKSGEWVEIDTKNPKHHVEVPVPQKHVDALGNEFTRTRLEQIPMSEQLRNNPFFEVREKGGKAISVAEKRKRHAPETAEEYQAYATDWINKGSDPDEMRSRWRREQPLRDKVGAADAVAEELFAIFSTKVEMMEMMAE